MSNLVALLVKFQDDNKAYFDQLALACTTANNGKAPTLDGQMVCYVYSSVKDYYTV